MGVKAGYYYTCRKCGALLDDINFFIQRLNPIKFDYLVKECHCCNSKYLASNNYEFFTISPNIFWIWLVSSLFSWCLILLIGILGIASLLEIDLYSLYIIPIIVFIILYCLNFKKRYDSAIQKSIKRFDDSSYIYDLLQFGLIDFNTVTKFYNNHLISARTYNDVIYNIKATHENNQQLEFLFNKLQEEK